jgi:hypothetical protein
MQETHRGLMDELPTQWLRATDSTPLSYRLDALGVPARFLMVVNKLPVSR